MKKNLILNYSNNFVINYPNPYSYIFFKIYNYFSRHYFEYNFFKQKENPTFALHKKSRMQDNFTHKEGIQIRWSDLDPLGHVNNAVFVTYFEIARGTYMMNASPRWNWKEDMFLIGNVNVNYLKELTLYNINPIVSVRTKKMGTKSFVLEYRVSSTNLAGENVIHAVGETTQIMFDMKNKKTIEMPDWLKEHLTNYEVDGSIEG